MNLSTEVLKYENEIVKIRRTIHLNPELSFNETETAKLVVAKLRSLGIDTVTGKAGTGVVGLLKGLKPGRVVALRADMDALPMDEELTLNSSREKKGSCIHAVMIHMLPCYLARQCFSLDIEMN